MIDYPRNLEDIVEVFLVPRTKLQGRGRYLIATDSKDWMEHTVILTRESKDKCHLTFSFEDMEIRCIIDTADDVSAIIKANYVLSKFN